ncbi:alpha/beta hydrolase [Acuticoccus sp. M5D2P5]|uniref:alpha/beta fold hydrolase n=1 Tax=Acuticoccus kalidii TaxID=2910977 RepID=UPI001F1D4CCB|nr:alpha/beta hydrolase [Acuticoccus kalidii]MCF3933106.1 alpha/beta hydrolase [Acuticoccus kalidii]
MSDHFIAKGDQRDASIRAPGETVVTWRVNGKPVPIGITRDGEGPTALLLPALSSISTRQEMADLQARLAPHYATVSVDWPGFGRLPRPFIDWTPVMFDGFVEFVLREVAPAPHLVVAAGHGAGYVARAFLRHPRLAERVIIVAPTWRGPLPTMMKGQRPWFAKLRRTMDRPRVGSLLYRANMSAAIIRKMVREHVYEDPAFLTPERFAQKRAVTLEEGARHGTARFVTGGLDPFTRREDMLSALGAFEGTLEIVYGASTPKGSKAEIEAMTALPAVEAHPLPHGKLLLHEEFAAEVADIVLAEAATGEDGRAR